MKNFVQPGENLEYIAPYALLSGDGFLDGVDFAVASTDAAQGAIVIGVNQGVFALKSAAVAITRKTVAYWDNTAKVVTNVAGSNTKIGIFQTSAAANAGTAQVRLVPSI